MSRYYCIGKSGGGEWFYCKTPLIVYIGILLQTACLAFAAGSSMCFNQDGSSNGNTPCTTGGNNTFCCSDGYYCLSNGLCEWQNGTFWQGTCTDQSWKSAACPYFCNDLVDSQLLECSTSSGTFCCGSDSCCSGQSSGILTLGQVSTIGFITSGILIPMTPSSTVTGTVTPTATSSSPTKSPAIPSSFQTETSRSTSTVPAPQATIGSSTPVIVNHTIIPAIIGATVGGFIGLVCLACIGYCLSRIRRKDKDLKNTKSTRTLYSKTPFLNPGPQYHQANDDWGDKTRRISESHELRDNTRVYEMPVDGY